MLRAAVSDQSRLVIRVRPGTDLTAVSEVLARLTFDWKVPEDLGPVAAVL